MISIANLPRIFISIVALALLTTTLPNTADAATGDERRAAAAAKRAAAQAEAEARRSGDVNETPPSQPAPTPPPAPQPAPPPANNPPTISGTPARTVELGKPYSFRPTASDADGDRLTFSIGGKPAWAQFSSSTGQLSGTPTSDSHIGTTGSIWITVSDGQSAANLGSFMVTVTAPPVAEPPPAPPPAAPVVPPVRENTPPSIAGRPLGAVQLGSLYSFTPAALDADRDALTFSIANKPAWAQFDSRTGRLRGTPTAARDVGTRAGIRITVSDGQAGASLIFAITVTAPPAAPPPVNEPPVNEPPVNEPPASANDPQSGSLVSGIQPTYYAWGQLKPGNKVYVDRRYTFVSVPAQYDGWRYLQTANDDKWIADPGHVRFNVTEPVRVIVAYDRRIADTPPAWLRDWTSTGVLIETTDAKLLAFRRDFPAGAVSIGGNEMGASNYGVAVAPLADIDVSSDPGTGPRNPAQPNSPPRISGAAPNTVDEGSSYSFIPDATDDNGDLLTFTITNKPSWAQFDSSTGALSGTPDGDDVGPYRDIEIRVSDGNDVAALPAFGIEVRPLVASGSTLLSWIAPTRNEDGSLLTDLAGFRVRYGRAAGQWQVTETVRNPGVTTFFVGGLAPGTWYFTVTAFDDDGNESREAEFVSAVIQ